MLYKLTRNNTISAANNKEVDQTAWIRKTKLRDSLKQVFVTK